MHTITHDRSLESLEEKARWFKTLSIEERLDMLSFLTDLALQRNPTLMEAKHDQSTSSRIRIIPFRNQT